MAPKKRGRKGVDMDEYVPSKSNKRVALHSDYQIHGRATHSLLPVPVSHALPSTAVPLEPQLDFNNAVSSEDDEYNHCEEDNREMEALGFSGVLTQPLERHKRQRTQAVSGLFF